MKKVLGYVGGDEGHVLADPIYGVPLAALYGGVALYLITHVVVTWYVAGPINRERIALVVLVLVLIPLVAVLPALLTLAVLTAVLGPLIAWETIRYAEARHQIRHDTAHGH